MKMVKNFRKTFQLSDLWVSSHERLTDFYASSWQRGESALPLLVLRLTLVAAAMALLAWSLAEAPTAYWLIYLTNWGLLLILAMALTGSAVSLLAMCKKIPDEGPPPWFVSTYWLMFNLAVTTALLITLLYWILLFSPDIVKDRLFWLELCTHGFNSLLVLVELLASRTPVRFAHIYQPLGLGLWYAVFTGIYYTAGGTDQLGNHFIYDVLDWQKPGQTIALVAASTAGLVVVYIALWGLALARDWVTGALIRTTSHELPFTPPDNHTVARDV